MYRIIYAVYFIGLAIFLINILSTIIFKKGTFKNKFKYALKSISFSLVWFLALFSSHGRKLLFGKINKL